MYKAKINNQEYIIINNKKYGPYDYVGEIAFSAKDNTLAYVVSIAENDYLIVGNETIGPHDSIHSLKFSADGKHIAYTVRVDTLGKKEQGKLLEFSDRNIRIFIHGQEHIGSFCNGEILYLTDRKIYKKGTGH